MENNSTWETLHEIALKAPKVSGVYLWRNKNKTVIYVGKAKNLHNRLSSYFSGQKDIKTRLLISNAISIEYITTTNEYEALLLENNLIKKYTPRYNINLKDGKSYPSLRITKEDFPRIIRTRNILKDGSTYFGPYPDSAKVDSFIESIFRIYPIRHCKQLKKREAPCLYYHMGQCKAPCCNKITKEEYTQNIEEIKNLLNGNNDESIKKLYSQMKEASNQLNFEKAGILRDGINAFKIMQNQNIVESFELEDKDYIAYACDGELVTFTVLKIRNGKLIGRENLRTQTLSEEDDYIAEFLACYYEKPENIPPTIFVESTTEKSIIHDWLKIFSPQTNIIFISEGEKHSSYDFASINMAKQNAKEDLVRRIRERGDIPALEELKSMLNLKNLPLRIEGFDIAHIGGKFPVASLISFYNGNPDKKNYRYFRLKTTDGIIDDFASMKEATTRRYTRLLNEQSELPDLILIDGGIGQVNAVKEVLDSLNLNIPMIGLAEKNEDIYFPGNSTPLQLPKRSDALRLLQRVRDETHRFATTKNQILRTKENTQSLFSQLPHIGTKKAIILIKEYSTLENLCFSTKEEIAQTANVTLNQAQEILEYADSLLKIQKEKKEYQRQSLGTSGTTKENAYTSSLIKGLADEALFVADNPNK